MSTKLIGVLARNPLLSHAVISALETAVLACILRVVGYHDPGLLAAVAVSIFYYGREAGQREHDLKHLSPPRSPLMAFLGAEYGFLWSLDNFLQWLVAAVSTTLVGILLTYYWLKIV